MLKITIIDYGIGNIRSLQNALKHLGAESILSDDKETILGSDAVILPGVGAFAHAMQRLQERDLISSITEFAQSGKPLLGICLGMQLLFEQSEEFEITKGLSLIRGRVTKLQNVRKLPHVGWYRLHKKTFNTRTILDGLDKEAEVYFVHSYAAGTDDAYILSTSFYEGTEFCSSVKKDNIYGCQFHPEKSGEAGLKILKNFIDIAKEVKK